MTPLNVISALSGNSAHLSTNSAATRRVAAFAAILAAALAGPDALAATGTWNTTTGTWDTSATNWTGVSGSPWDAMNGPGNTALFNTSGAVATVSGTVYVNSMTFSQAATVSGGTITLAGATPGIVANAAVTIGSTLAGLAGLIKTGAGTLTLSVANSYTGGTTISAGTVSISNAGALGSGTVTLNGGTLSLDGLGLSNAITLNNTANMISAVGNYRVLSGKISGVGGFTFGGGSSTPGITLTNSANDFQGNVTINASHFLRIGANNVIPDTATVNVAGALRIDGNRTETIAGLTGAGNVFSTTGSAVSTLSIGAGDTSSTFSGSFGTSGNLGAINVEKVGTGTFTLAAANTLAVGTTTVSGGTLALTSAGTTGSGAVTLMNGGTLLGTGVVRGGTFTAQSGSSVYAGTTTAQGDYGTLSYTPASGSGSFDFQSGSAVVLGINPGGASDLLSFNGLSAGTLLFNGNLQVTASGYVPIAPETFNLLDWANVSMLTFASRYQAGSYGGNLLGNGDDNLGFDLPNISGSGYAWDISQFIVNGTISVVQVPEPGRALLLLPGLGVLLARRRRCLR